MLSLNNFIFEFWKAFCKHFDPIGQYLKNTSNEPANMLRNMENGGNLLFRPIGLIPFVKAVIAVHNLTKEYIESVIFKASKIEFELNSYLWKNILWNPNGKKMIMDNQTLTTLLIVHLID